MKTAITICTILFLAAAGNTLLSQERLPREYIPVTGKITLSRSAPLYQAIQILSEVSGRIDRKIIIDETGMQTAINVDILDMHWRDALDLIAKMNGLSCEEFPNYIKVVSGGANGEKKATPAGIKKEEFNSGMREVTISAIFFEGDRHALKERGINWEVLVKKGNVITEVKNRVITDQGSQQGNTGTGGQSNAIENAFTGRVTYEKDDNSLMGFLKVLETESVGEVLANPTIQVIEGQKGRVQVGQDFSIKQLDFAGNVVDNFVSSGIILTVEPTVIAEDSLKFIHLDVQAERSSVSPSALTTIINKTHGQTSVFLLDGERTVMAGLYSTDVKTERTGIPLLKDLPGWFFGIRYLAGYDRKDKTEKELIIILKAVLIPSLRERTIPDDKLMEYIKERRKELSEKFKG